MFALLAGATGGYRTGFLVSAAVSALTAAFMLRMGTAARRP